MGKRVTLKGLAEYLDLSPAAISRALNGSLQANALAPETRVRVLQAARKLRYRPNYLARSLRGKKPFSVGVLVPVISEGYAVLPTVKVLNPDASLPFAAFGLPASMSLTQNLQQRGRAEEHVNW